MKRASAIKVILSCTGLEGKKKTIKKTKKKQFQFNFFSEIGNFNVAGPVNQLIKKDLSLPSGSSVVQQCTCATSSHAE
jgi:hypothetical protein